MNLNGGLAYGECVWTVGLGHRATGQVNFNGGTLQASEASTARSCWRPAPTIYSGGATIDNNGHAITIGQPLLAPAGNGVHGIASFTGGLGYIAPPIVTHQRRRRHGRDGHCADQSARQTAAVTNVMITCPGVNYTATPTFTLTGGGCDHGGHHHGHRRPRRNASGGLTVIGTGKLTLTGASTYTGTTTVINQLARWC